MANSILRKVLNLFSKEQIDFDFNQIEHTIDYRFNNKKLLLKAFKHRSYLSISKENQLESNERLEFLGDAILDHATTIFLYTTYPQKTEGQLSQMKSVLVSRPVLAEICKNLNIGRFLLIDRGEEKTGGRSRKSNLANLFEALIGAIYLDGGFRAADQFLNNTLLINFKEILEKKKYFNYKSILLEYSQSKGMGSPIYSTIVESGPDHDKKFVIEVGLNSKQNAKGTGRSKKVAEQEAARNLLKKISPQLIEK
ncbi:ribonuclease III [Calditrichota bacterium]